MTASCLLEDYQQTLSPAGNQAQMLSCVQAVCCGYCCGFLWFSQNPHLSGLVIIIFCLFNAYVYLNQPKEKKRRVIYESVVKCNINEVIFMMKQIKERKRWNTGIVQSFENNSQIVDQHADNSRRFLTQHFFYENSNMFVL